MDGQEERLGRPEETQTRVPGPKSRTSGRVGPDERIAAERDRQEREFTEDRDLTDEERLEMFRDSQYQSVLPDLPQFPGFHTFWATTTNARDTIQRRIRLGYKPIRVEECPGWEGIGLQTGDYAGVIGVNEMIAMRLPLKLYNLYMHESHHAAPLAEEEKLRAQTANLRDEAESRGSLIEEGDGTANIVQKAVPPQEFYA